MIKIKFGRKKVGGIVVVKAPDFFQAGIQIGETLQKQTAEAVKNYKIKKLVKEFPDWFKKGKDLSQKVTPNAFKLVTGIGEGAGLEEDEAFGLWYEELFYADQKDKSKLKDTGCTDVVVKSGDNVIIGHTNDESPGDGSRLFQIDIDGRERMYMAFTRGCPSIALNTSGMVFSGNQVDANDTRSGIPRMMLYMEGALSDSIEKAKKLFLHKDRASSFNNIVANEDGFIKTLEASATAQKEVDHQDGSIEAHSNHFIWLTGKEGREDESYDRSVNRLDRAYEEAEEAGRDMSVEDMKKILATHGKGGLCRHSTDKNGTATVFAVIFLPKERKFYYCDGNPCEGRYKEITY